MTSIDIEKSEEGSLRQIWQWFLYKFNYGLGTNKGLITFTIIWEFVIVLFLSTFTEPITAQNK